ncbi:MAG TPA: ABC transporter ATP-binding protein, partial [Pirellulales bacterium]
SGLSLKEIRRRRPALLETVGLAKWGTVSVKKYSKGMLQRLGLAQAMLHEPDLLILDEPTDGVDPLGRSEMRAVLQQLKHAGKTVFLNSHLLQEIELICDRVAILNHGEVLREGRIADLTLRPEAELQFVLLAGEARIRAALAGYSLGQFQATGAEQFQVMVRVADQAAADRCVDDLRRQGISIAGMSRSRQTLEEAFLSIVGATPKAGPA